MLAAVATRQAIQKFSFPFDEIEILFPTLTKVDLRGGSSISELT
jgi:hypothetical protein